MSYNGSGTFVINSAGMPLVPFQRDLSATFNALTADLATGLSTAITKDGQTTTTALITFAAGISSTLVTDATSISTGAILTLGGLGVTKAAWIGGLINVAGAATLQSTLAVTGAATLSSTLSVTGTTSFSAGLINSGTTVARFQSTTSGAPAGSTGSGVEIYAGNIFSYNRTTSAFVPLTIETSALTVNAPITITGTSAGNMLKIVASASGTRGDATYQSWFRADGTTRKGYFGFAGADTADITLATEESGGTLQFYTAGAQVGQFTAGGYLKASPDPAILFNATAAYHEFIGNSASVGAFRTRSQSATFAGTAALVYVDRAASTLFNLLDMQSGGVSKFLVDGTGNTTISGTVQPTLSLAKTNATAATWQIYNNGNLVFYDGTNYPLYFLGANSVFGGAMDVASATGGQYLLVGATQSGASKSAYMQLYGTDAGSASKRWYVGINPFRTDGSYEVVTSAGTGVYIVPAATAWTATSDERLKDIIEPITDAVNKVSTLRAVIGKFKTDSEETRRSFLIAQDVQSVFPEAVEASDPDKLGVQYTDMIPLLVAAIKELAADFQSYKNSHP